DLSFAKIGAIWRNPLGEAVAHERCRRRTPRRDAHPTADDAATDRCGPVGEQFLPRRQNDAQAQLGLRALKLQATFHRREDLSDTEEANDRNQEVEAVQEVIEAERHAELAGDAIHADGGEREAESHGREGLPGTPAPHADETR